MKFDFSESFYRVLLVIVLYILSTLMIYCFFYLDSSEELRKTLKKVDDHSTATGFKFYALIGIIQYGLLIAGLSIVGTLTFIIIKKIKPLLVLF